MSVLEGRRALVTGAGQGVGRGVAAALGAEGAHVVVNDLVTDRAESVVDEIRRAGGVAEATTFDVTDHDAVVAALAGAPIDILVNNAGNAGQEGTFILVPFVETDPGDWPRFVDVNLYGVLRCTHVVLPAMIARKWGRVVTIVSDAGRSGDAGMAVYSAAKAGAAGFSRSLAAEVGRYGVTVNAVSLGTMRTPLSEAFWHDGDSAAQQRILSRYAIRRPGDPEDVAGLVGFLCSPAASWITGQTYPVNGGSSFAL